MMSPKNIDVGAPVSMRKWGLRTGPHQVFADTLNLFQLGGGADYTHYILNRFLKATSEPVLSHNCKVSLNILIVSIVESIG